MTVTLYFFFNPLFVFFPGKDNKMRVWLGTATTGQKGQTRGTASASEADVRQEAKDTVWADCEVVYNDLMQIMG